MKNLLLKSDATEAAHIVAVVRLHALAAPHCAFTLIEDGRVIFRSPTCPALSDRVGEIFGRQLADSLLAIDVAESGLRLHGLIAKPGSGGRATRHETITFVNRRPVDSRTLAYGLIESYHEVLPKGRYPAAFVFLELDPAAGGGYRPPPNREVRVPAVVDTAKASTLRGRYRAAFFFLELVPAGVYVNVHPTKREVRFRSEAQVRSFVIRTVLATLRSVAPPVAAMGVVELVSPAAPSAPVSVPVFPSAPSTPVARPPAATPVAAKAAPSSVSWTGPTVARPPASAPVSAPVVSPVSPSAMMAKPAPSTGAWRFIGLAHTTYALFETPAGLLMLDRRAAQERIVFEELATQFSAGAVTVQRLLLPVVLELDPVGAALLRDRLKFLAKHGFEVAEFGRATFRLEGVPAVLDPADGEACLRDLLDAFRDGRSSERDPEVAREQLARLAAARAVRLSSHADAAEMRALVAKLFACRAPHTSPGGRPTQVEWSQGEIARRFGRG